MDNDGVSTQVGTTVNIAGIDFDRIAYDAGGDVLYLHVGDPKTAVDWDATPEGHATRYAADGRLVGLTIVNARWLLERDGKIVLTLPEHRVEATQLDALLA